jgi:hypothetical protein
VKIGVPKETAAGERRVALVPDVVKSLKKNEHVEVLVERDAGVAAGHPDSQYAEAGAEVVDGEVTWGADVVLRVAAPSAAEIGKLNPSQTLIAHLAKTRSLCAGTVIGSGTVSNRDAGGGPGKPVADGGLGYSCIAEVRTVETILHGKAETPFLKAGDTVRIEMLDDRHHSIFGAIEQTVEAV